MDGQLGILNESDAGGITEWKGNEALNGMDDATRE
jgi:hypothetical protein